jgi:outer membrane protein OmpA-like peptidoglycan-associated protein
VKKTIIVISAVAVLLAGCAGMNRQQKGTIAGALGGAAAGAALSDGSVWAAIAGAAIGGAAGNRIGKNMDEQARELEQAVPTAEVNRVGEGINMTFESGLMFEINSATLSESYKDDLAAAAAVFGKYPDTNILVEGHTDDSGAEDYNLSLSERRAKAVTDHLVANGMDRSRFEVRAYGETQPKYPNDSDANRSKNRRVELGIFANEDMKQQAQAGTL